MTGLPQTDISQDSSASLAPSGRLRNFRSSLTTLLSTEEKQGTTSGPDAPTPSALSKKNSSPDKTKDWNAMRLSDAGMLLFDDKVSVASTRHVEPELSERSGSGQKRKRGAVNFKGTVHVETESDTVSNFSTILPRNKKESLIEQSYRQMSKPATITNLFVDRPVIWLILVTL